MLSSKRRYTITKKLTSLGNQKKIELRSRQGEFVDENFVSRIEEDKDDEIAYGHLIECVTDAFVDCFPKLNNIHGS